MPDGAGSMKNDIVKGALERFEQSSEGSETNREAYYEDTKFARMADQWPDEIKKQRVQEGRPALVVNKLPAFIRAVVNESRQNKPAVKVSPVDNGADEEHADVIGGIIRSVERNSHAEVAYDTAIDNAVTGGFGFFRIDIDYAHELSFDMEAHIKRIPNALAVHWDTNSSKHDASDWEYAFISDVKTHKEFKRLYPEALMVDFEGDDRDQTSGHWLMEETIRVSEYFLRTPETFKLMQLSLPNPETGEADTQAVREEDLLPMAMAFFQLGEQEPPSGEQDAVIGAWMAASGVQLLQEREATRHRVKRHVISGLEVLEEDSWPGQHIPICPVWGDEVFLDGKRNFRSMIRDSKDPQQMLNFWRSASTELVALAPKTPFIGEKGFVPKGDEDKWESANTRSHAYLEYAQGKERPQRQEFAGVPAGVVQEAANNVDDMKSIMGIFDSSLGARSNEVSGRAIMARERQGDVSNFHFIDNLNRAIRWGGQILVDIIPSVYSARQSIRILGDDQKVNVVNLTQDTGGMAGGQSTSSVTGQPKLYNISIGKYDVDVKTGPSYATEREETRETLIEIMRQVPDAAPFIGDVLLDHMDFVGADKVAKRLKALLPPEVRQSEEAEEQSDDPEKAALQQQLQAKTQEMEQAKQAVMAEIQKLTQENEGLKAKHGADAARAKTEESKARGAFENEKRKLDQEDRKLEMAERKLRLEEDTYATQPAPVAPVTPEEQWEYDRLTEADRQAHEAEQNALDRKADLAKTIIGKADTSGEGVDEDVLGSIHEAAEAVAEPVAQRRQTEEGRVADALGAVLEAMSADRVLVRDGQGRAVGSKIMGSDAPDRILVRDENGNAIGSTAAG